jgi:hypothetical protein
MGKKININWLWNMIFPLEKKKERKTKSEQFVEYSIASGKEGFLVSTGSKKLYTHMVFI